MGSNNLMCPVPVHAARYGKSRFTSRAQGAQCPRRNREIHRNTDIADLLAFRFETFEMAQNFVWLSASERRNSARKNVFGRTGRLRGVLGRFGRNNTFKASHWIFEALIVSDLGAGLSLSLPFPASW